MKWLITGGCGFIGMNLYENLIKDLNNEIIIVDNLSVGNIHNFLKIDKNIKDNFRINKLKLEIFEIISNHKPDIIIHLANKLNRNDSLNYPITYMTNNFIGTFNLLESARLNNIQKIIYLSETKNYNTPYDGTQEAIESYLMTYNISYNMQNLILKTSNIYGPHSLHKNEFIFKTIKTLIDGHSDIMIPTNDNNEEEYIFIDDIISAIKQSIIKNIKGKYSISSQILISYKNIIEMLIKLCRERGIYPINYNIINEKNTMIFDNTYLDILPNWASRTLMIDGFDKTLMWFMQNYK